jgi:hypothetical protein
MNESRPTPKSSPSIWSATRSAISWPRGCVGCNAWARQTFTSIHGGYTKWYDKC